MGWADRSGIICIYPSTFDFCSICIRRVHGLFACKEDSGLDEVRRVAGGNRRTRRGQREMRKRFLPIDRLFDLPPTDLNDGVERE